MRQFCVTFIFNQILGGLKNKPALLHNDLSLIQSYADVLCRRNLPKENLHAIDVAPFLGTKLSLEADMLLLLSDIELVSLLCALGN